jgi:transcriptional regulator with XRE-family HTH domain
MNAKDGTVDTKFLKSLMKVKNLSESQFADRIGVSHSMVNRVLNGKRGAGTKFLIGILRAFDDVSMDQIYSSVKQLPKGNKVKKTA